MSYRSANKHTNLTTGQDEKIKRHGVKTDHARRTRSNLFTMRAKMQKDAGKSLSQKAHPWKVRRRSRKRARRGKMTPRPVSAPARLSPAALGGICPTSAPTFLRRPFTRGGVAVRAPTGVHWAATRPVFGRREHTDDGGQVLDQRSCGAMFGKRSAQAERRIGPGPSGFETKLRLEIMGIHYLVNLRMM